MPGLATWAARPDYWDGWGEVERPPPAHHLLNDRLPRSADPMRDRLTMDDDARTRRRDRYAVIGERNRIAEMGARRVMWRDLAVSALMCMVWCLAGLALIGMALHVIGEVGWVWFWGGLLIGNGGIILTLARLYRRGTDRGDW